MGRKSQVDDNVSSSDQISHGFVSSISDNKTPKQISLGTEFSSERVHPAKHTLVRSDVSSEKRKNLSASTTEEISQGDSTITVPYPHKQLKVDSSSSKNSGTMGQLSSVDSVGPKPTRSMNNREYSNPTRSVESKNAFQDSKHYITSKSDPDAASKRSSHYAFDLNEDMETNGANWHPETVQVSNYPSDNAVSSEPIPVVAKMGVPIGLPKKPLQFGGNLGWKSSGITSAFHSTPLTNPEKARVFRGFDFDLNVAATIDPEVLTDPASVFMNSKEPEKLHFANQKGNKNCHRPGTSGIDLNNNPNPMIKDACKSIYPQGEPRQLLPVPCYGSSVASYASNYPRPPYWVDQSSVRGFGNVQGQALLMVGPNTSGQVQMVVPIQLPYTPPGIYMGKMNGLTPAFYPSNVLAPLHNQPGPILASYPRDTRLLENSQGLNMNPHAYANMRQTFLSNDSIALMENAGRAGNSSECFIPARNPLYDQRKTAVEQVARPASSMKRR